MERKIVRNAVRCLACGNTMESKHRHDFAMCPCDNGVFTDGGLVYLRMGARDINKMESLVEYQQDDTLEYEGEGG